MSKKKKKKKSISILKEVDKSLNGTYEDLIQEIEDMQLRLNYADQKARKKAKKLAKKNGSGFYDYETLRKEARMEVVGMMESNNFIDRAMKVLNDIAPIIVVIGRLIASLILAILSLDSVKINIKPETLNGMNAVYKKAMALH